MHFFSQSWDSKVTSPPVNCLMYHSEASELVEGIPETTDSSSTEQDRESTLRERSREQRPFWDNKAQYILSLVGYAVGVGNVWRFPYLCEKYGGGAFLIPYLIMLFVEGLPLFYLELSIGHRFRSGTVGSWRQIAPAFTGIGISMGLTSYVVGLYYVIVMTWSLFYMFVSFQDPLPWTTCKGVDGTVKVNSSNWNISGICASSKSRFYWYNTAIKASPDIEHTGYIVWQLALCLILSWTILFICLIKGIKSTGKAVYVTALLPYIVLTALFFRGVTLEGAGKGVAYLFTPEVRISTFHS